MKPVLVCTVQGAEDVLPPHGTRQTVTVVTADGTAKKVSGIMSVYKIADGSGYAVFVTP